jgi:hypothetical protein
LLGPQQRTRRDGAARRERMLPVGRGCRIGYSSRRLLLVDVGFAAEADPADHAMLAALVSVFCLPLVVDETARDGDGPSLREMLGARVGTLAERRNVDEQRRLVLWSLTASRKSHTLCTFGSARNTGSAVS